MAVVAFQRRRSTPVPSVETPATIDGVNLYRTKYPQVIRDERGQCFRVLGTNGVLIGSYEHFRTCVCVLAASKQSYHPASRSRRSPHTIELMRVLQTQVAAATLHHGGLRETLDGFSEDDLLGWARAVPGLSWDPRKRWFLVRRGRTYMGTRVHPQDAAALVGCLSGQAISLPEAQLCFVTVRV